MKIAHISDTHILTLKRHDEYRQIFSQIYNKLRENKVDYIVHTGDLFHSKLQLTPECVGVAAEFLKSLADIAPTYVIAGNHDTNLRNNKRLDSISPIVEAMDYTDLFYLKNSGPVYARGVVFNVLSVFDKENWVKFKSEDSDAPIIALYHGSIKGTITDTGYVVEHGDDDISIFEGHDYALLGDIHLANQKVDDEGRMRYAGSTVQQNFGEDDNKGFLIWDIKDKDTFSVEHFAIKCPKPFINFHISSEGALLNERKIPAGARVRLISDMNLPLEKVKNSIDYVKLTYKPESIVYANKTIQTDKGLEGISNLSQALNLRDLSVQEELMRTFLKDYNLDEETLQKVFELNKKYALQAEQNEDVARNINWSIKSFEWDNLFNYGEGNRLDFSKLNGIVGILGKNWSGKSSIIESMLYTIYNNTAKNNRKNLNIINQNKELAKGRAVLEIEGNEYVIERKSEKYQKKSKGVEYTEAKTDVEFTCETDGLLTGLDRSDTDKNIRRFVGSLDDFLLTSMSSQLNSLAFIGEGSTNRKAILAKFLDLDTFEVKYKLAKADSADIKALLKKTDGYDFDAEIKKTQDLLTSSNSDINDAKFDSQSINLELTKLRQDLFNVQGEIKNLEKSSVDVTKFFEQKASIESQIDKNEQEKTKVLTRFEQHTAARASIEKGDLDINVDELMRESGEIEASINDLQKLEGSYRSAKGEKASIEKRLSILSEVPCGPEFSNCKFITDAYGAKSESGPVEQLLVSLNTRIKDVEKLADRERLAEIKNMISRYSRAIAIEQKVVGEERSLNEFLSKINEQLSALRISLQTVKDEIAKQEANKELLKELESLKAKQKELTISVYNTEKALNSKQQSISELYKRDGYLLSTLEKLQEDKDDAAQKRKEYSAYDLYLKCMHANGISYEVIKNKLPIINSEINKILSNVVDFQIQLLNEDDKLDIMIKHPSYDPRPLEMGSGAEKSLAAIAIRLALLTVSSLPKANFFILDEPGTAFDPDNLAGFIRILDLIKGYFKVVFLISHLDILKDAVDMQINIEKIEGYAHVEQ